VVYLKNGSIFLFNNNTASDCRSTAEKLLKDPVRRELVRCIRYSKADLGKHPEDGCWLEQEGLSNAVIHANDLIA